MSILLLLSSCFSSSSETASTKDSQWYSQGAFNFARLDGGSIEVDKGLVTGWKYLEDFENREITSQLYNRYSDEVIALAQKMSVDWIWLTWSTGFSLEYEEKHQREVEQLVKKAHQAGLKVTAYLSLTNIFWEEMYSTVPESKNWVLTDSQGRTRLYGKKHTRRHLGDIGHLQWRTYLKQRVSRAINADFDAIYFDNISFKKTGDVNTFVAEVRKLAAELRPAKKIPVYLNTLNREIISEGDLLLAETTREPSLSEGKLPSNLSAIKYLRKRVSPQKAVKFEHRLTSKGQRRETLISAQGYKLSIAEAAAYQTSFYVAPEGVTMTHFIRETAEGKEAIAAIGNYNGFLRKNRNLYRNALWLTDSIDNPERLRISIPKQSGVILSLVANSVDGQYSLHVINYEQTIQPSINLDIDRDLLDKVAETVNLLTPDGQNTKITAIDWSADKVSVEISNLRTYAVLTLGH